MDQAEALRNVVKLKKQENKPNARVITITSGKGGVGKSNVAVNLAVWMKKCGKRVIIFDADFGLANVEVMFGAAPRYNLSDVLYHGKRIADVITEGPDGHRIYLRRLRHCGVKQSFTGSDGSDGTLLCGA